MSELPAIQIDRPADEQAFERASRVLWSCELDDPNVQLYGRRGKNQYGVDLFGIRNGDPNRVVGVQCKQMMIGKELSEASLRAEVKKALTFKPLLSEYIICTTADDDPDLQAIALQLSQELSAGRAKPLTIRIWGWGTMQNRIQRHPEARKAFDPTHTSHGDIVVEKVNTLIELSARTREAIEAIGRTVQADPADAAANAESEIDRQITNYAQKIETAPQMALDFFSTLRISQFPTASGRIRFRIDANIAACHFALGDDATAAAGFIAAYEHDPLNPKAVADKALGLLINNDWAALRPFAEKMLGEQPDNALLACYFIQGMAQDPSFTDPTAVVPEAVRGSPAVALAVARLHVQRQEEELWIAQAIKARAAHPDNIQIAEQYAHALAARVIGAKASRFGYRLTADERADLNQAAAILDERWQAMKASATRLRHDAVAIPANLMVVLRLLGEKDRAVIVGQEAIVAFPDDEQLKEKTTATLLEAGRETEAETLLGQLPVTRDTSMMRFHVLMRKDAWAELVELVTTHLSLFPEGERTIVKAARAVATANLAAPSDRPEILKSGIAEADGDPRALALLAQCSRRNGLMGLAQTCYESARAGIESKDDGFAARYAVAHEAFAFGDWRTIADMFFAHLDFTVDTPELRLLANALLNDYPVRVRAEHFFASLPDALKAKPFYQRAAGIVELNRGDVGAAIPLLTSAFAQQREVAFALPLVIALVRSGRYAELDAFLSDLSIDSTPGLPGDRVRFAQILNERGLGKRAIMIGYDALRNAPENPDVAQKYAGLIIEPAQDVFEGLPDTLANGLWVEMVDGEGGRLEGIVGESRHLPWAQPIPIDHPLVQAAMGKKAGESFTHTANFGVEKTWTIETILPPWFRAGKDLLENIETRFPSVKSVVRIHVGDGDLSKVFEQIRRKGKADEKLIETYLKNPFPLAFLAANHRAGAVGFADFVASRGHDVRTHSGSTAQLRAAIAAIRANGGKGAVLDGFTAWRAAQLGLLPLLKEVLGPLSVPSSELDDLRELIALQKPDRAGQSMSASYRDGQFYREEISQDDRRRAAETFTAILADIEAHCDVAAVSMPDNLPEIAEALIESPGSDVIAPAILAGESRLLLSDDMAFRQLSTQLFKTKGVWLQAVLMVALDAKTMPFDEYVRALRQLAALRHGVVVFDFATLLKVYRSDDTSRLLWLSAVCRYMGHETADALSHTALAANFLNTIWATALARDGRVEAATGIIIAALMTNEREGMWPYWAALLATKLVPGPREQLFAWCRAKGRSIDAIRDAAREIAAAEAAEEDGN